MEISWFGQSCFQLRGKNVVLITDPFGETLRLAKLNPAIITLSHSGDIAAVGGNPRIVRSPGEYEISEVLITGIAANHGRNSAQEDGRNTIYLIHLDELAICHLGNLRHPLREEQLEEVADADILLVPIGGDHALNVTQAVEVISRIEPHIVIPMHYPNATAEDPSPALATFCREMGRETINPQPKLSVTQNSLPTEMQVVVLAAKP